MLAEVKYLFLLFMFIAECSALDYHGTSRRLFVGLAGGTIAVSVVYNLLKID